MAGAYSGLGWNWSIEQGQQVGPQGLCQATVPFAVGVHAVGHVESRISSYPRHQVHQQRCRAETGCVSVHGFCRSPRTQLKPWKQGPGYQNPGARRLKTLNDLDEIGHPDLRRYPPEHIVGAQLNNYYRWGLTQELGQAQKGPAGSYASDTRVDAAVIQTFTVYPVLHHRRKRSGLAHAGASSDAVSEEKDNRGIDRRRLTGGHTVFMYSTGGQQHEQRGHGPGCKRSH